MLKTLMKSLTLAGLLAVAACNTVEGIGKDVESVGRKTQDVAR